MSNLRSMQRGFNGSRKLSAGDEAVLFEMDQRQQAIIARFTENFAALTAQLARERAERLEAQKAAEARIEETIHEVYLFVTDEQAVLEEKVQRTISFRLVAAWRAVAYYLNRPVTLWKRGAA